MRPAAVARSCGVLLLAALCGCGEGVPAPCTPASFTVLGRWREPLQLTYSVEEADEALLGPAVRAAVEVWNEADVVLLMPAAEKRAADVTFGFREGAHEACPPFGANDSLAHAGPQAAPSFVHFDRARVWAEAGGQGYSLQRAAAHEIGHVLGIGHSEDELALMYPVPDDTWPPRLGASDRAALHSLYGGGDDGPGDVSIDSKGGAGPLTLRRVAPPSCTDLETLDTDGDGDDELLVWRTDEAGHGALLIYHFEKGPRLARTVGPVPGVVPPATAQVAGTTPDGERLLVSLLPDGGWRARSFDAGGLPRARGASALVLGSWRDEDGDGRWEETGAQPFPRATEWTADLDGDGIVERLERR